MVNIKNKRCAGIGCEKHANFGTPGQKATHCGKCALDGMKNVVAKRCAADGCEKHASYGTPGKKATHCGKCALDGMKNVVAKRCTADGCETQAHYGTPGQTATHCAKCAPEGMEKLSANWCPGPPGGDGCPARIMVRLMQYCVSCDPETSRQRRRRTAERLVLAALAHEGLVPTERDMRVDYACLTATSGSKYCLLDAVFDFQGLRIVLEVDEHAHATYDASCEVRREQDAQAAMLLSGDERPVAWVRLNPHETTAHDEKVRVRLVRQRCAEAAREIRRLCAVPCFELVYVGYPPTRIAELQAARLG